MNPEVVLVEDAGALERVCAQVARAERIALDTEFHTERSYAPRLMVLQIVIGDGVFVIDALRLRDLRPLVEAIAPTMVVGHALQGDLKIFADRYRCLPSSAFDTQLAAAFCGFGLAISLADLVHDVTGVRLRKSQTVSDWSTRPLSPGQIEYLVDDVRHLLAVADAMRTRLERAGRFEWFEEDARRLVDLKTYRADPERLYLRIPGATRMNRRELGILRELAILRDELARERDVPVKYIIPDDVMAGIVALRPAARDDLAQLRRLNGGTRKAYGQRIVQAVTRGLALSDEQLPRKPARPPGAEREAIVACLSVLVSAIARENDLPAALLTPRAALERVARELPKTTAELSDVLDATPWRAALVAEPLHALLSGQIALTVAGAAEANPRVAQISATGGAPKA